MMKQGIMSLQEGGETPPQGDRISELKKRLRKIISTYREQQRLSEQLLNPLHEGQYLTSSGNFITDLGPEGLTGQGNKWSALDDADFLNQIDWEGMEEIEKLISQGVDIDDIEDFVNRGILTAPAEAAGGGMFTDPDTKQLKMSKPDVDWGEGVYHLDGTPLTAADWAGSDFFDNLTMDYFGDDAKLMGHRLRQLADTNPGAFQGLLDYLNESDDVGTWQDELLYGKKSKRWFYPKSISNLYDDPNVSFTEGLYRDLNQWIDRMSDEEFAEEIAQANREKKISSPRVNMDLHKALQEIKADSPVPSRGARLTGPGPLDTKLMSILPFGALAGKTAIHTALQAIPLGPLDALEIAVTPEKLGSGQLLEDPEFTDEELIRYYSDFLGPDLGIMSSDLDFEQFFDNQPEPGTPMLDVLGRR